MAVKKRSGRPTKFSKEVMLLVKYMLEHGATDKDVAKELGVTDRTFYNWRNAYPEFFQSLKDWKDNADREVEISLFKRATGYTTEETKVFYNKATGEVVTKTIKKHFPPDPTSMIFWLKNRQPDRWREKQIVAVENNEDKAFSFALDIDPEKVDSGNDKT